MTLNSKVPDGPTQETWAQHRFHRKPLNPANNRKYTATVGGTGPAGPASTSPPAEPRLTLPNSRTPGRPRRDGRWVGVCCSQPRVVGSSTSARADSAENDAG